jgi:hypothetical protein
MENLVPYPPDGLVVALQYWAGDEAPAMRLARLLAAIEPRYRSDVTLAFCRRFDCEVTALAEETFWACARSFRVMNLLSHVEAKGHPDGCNGLMQGTAMGLSGLRQLGKLEAGSVFLIEADGVPACHDWIDRLQLEHQQALLSGRRVTGAYTEGPVPRLPHINGSLVAHLSLFQDRPSLLSTPLGHAWDLFHAPVLLGEALRTPLIKNVYGSRGWTPGVLAAMANETAWLANVKDDSAIAWAESELPRRARAA